MKIIKTSFDKLKNGTIIHQVNCHGIVGSHSINTKIFNTFPESKKILLIYLKTASSDIIFH